MYWEQKPLSYEICIPPLKKPFSRLTHQETEEYFQWHLSHLSERISYLSSVVSNSLAIHQSELDLSPGSLLPLWSWFLAVAELEPTPMARLMELNQQYHTNLEQIRAYLLDQSQDQFSLETEFILRDVGMYLGQVFTKNEPGICWSYYEKPKSDFFVNMPVLLGFEDSNYHPPFKMVFEPLHMAKVQAAKIWYNTQREDDLFRIYSMWAKNFVPSVKRKTFTAEPDNANEGYSP